MADVILNLDPNQAPEFVVDGTKIPDVDVCWERNEGGTIGLRTIQFDVGESYAGLVPISSAANETRKLFFWYT